VTELEPPRLPSTPTMLEWIDTIVAKGIRRPGYRGDTRTEQWAAARLGEMGLDVHLEPVEVTRWRPSAASLLARLDHDPTRAVELPGFALPFTAPTSGTSGPLLRLAEAGAAGTGFLAVDEMSFMQLPQSTVRDLATATYDPEGVFDTLVQTLPLGPRRMEVVEPAIEAGAAGYVGALTGVPWETHDYYVPCDAVPRPIPGLWLSRRDALCLLALMDAGPCTGTLIAPSEVDEVSTNNVVATLPGSSDSWVLIGSHHDAPWASAVGDASGIALMLAAAHHWSRVPRPERPHNLMFLLTSGHMARAAGTRAFIEGHRDLLPQVVLQLHLEHAARRCEAHDGTLVATDAPEVRWWFTSRIPALERLVQRSIGAEDLRRSFVLPPDAFSPMPPTDGACFHRAGVPLVHFLTAPVYLFDSADTLDKVDADGLLPLSRAAVRIVAGTAGWSPPARAWTPERSDQRPRFRAAQQR
jgi:hypothetical protein